MTLFNKLKFGVHMTILIWLLCTWSSYAYAGIWGGGLCRFYKQVVDDELIAFVSIGSCALAIILWMLDDKSSAIKLWILRIVAATLMIFNLPIFWTTIFGRSPVCG